MEPADFLSVFIVIFSRLSGTDGVICYDNKLTFSVQCPDTYKCLATGRYTGCGAPEICNQLIGTCCATDNCNVAHTTRILQCFDSNIDAITTCPEDYRCFTLVKIRGCASPALCDSGDLPGLSCCGGNRCNHGNIRVTPSISLSIVILCLLLLKTI